MNIIMKVLFMQEPTTMNNRTTPQYEHHNGYFVNALTVQGMNITMGMFMLLPGTIFITQVPIILLKALEYL